ncbi:AraC family transcriptional regulator [Jeotgalibaca sp. MA1X17-3]|uniref:AraC family transcriptional regulator n=1 Tax=Jeotgalibaca sp. MA1X17-3 TaxID=2908211 RepID=UPI001F2AD62A|nr:AraC family transcriptional regulator [Jeotgalibaca sp. MA1X17-3]UJF15353.1 AraC family transcriptional regulator [Jeotgalibaca sp. MA1X17-3]
MSTQVYEVKDKEVQHLPVQLLYVTESIYGDDWHSTFHSHFFTEMMYITKGSGHFVSTTGQIPFETNQVILVNENIQHTERSNPNDPVEYIALGFRGLSFKDAENGELIPFSIYDIKEDKKEIQFILKILLSEVKKTRYQDSLISHNLLEVLLVHLFRGNRIELEKTTLPLFNKDISVVKHFIDRNYHDSISLDQLAEISHMNKYYLAHSFKKSMGVSPIEYLNKIRIGKSMHLLESTDHPIAFIASLTGFSSASYFSQAFKRITKLSPQEYRKSKKEDLSKQS